MRLRVAGEEVHWKRPSDPVAPPFVRLLVAGGGRITGPAAVSLRLVPTIHHWVLFPLHDWVLFLLHDWVLFLQCNLVTLAAFTLALSLISVTPAARYGAVCCTMVLHSVGLHCGAARCCQKVAPPGVTTPWCYPDTSCYTV